MERVDQQYLNHRRSCLKEDAQKAQAHLNKHKGSVANIVYNLNEKELVIEVFKQVLSARQFARCTFISK